MGPGPHGEPYAHDVLHDRKDEPVRYMKVSRPDAIKHDPADTETSTSRHHHRSAKKQTPTLRQKSFPREICPRALPLPPEERLITTWENLTHDLDLVIQLTLEFL